MTQNDDASPPGDTDDVSIVYGIRRSERATSFSRRDSSALSPIQFMEVEVYLAAAEICLERCSFLGHIGVLLVLLHHRLSKLLVHWQRISSTAAYLLENLRVTTKKIKNAVGYIIMIIRWIKCHGEMAMLAAQDLTYFVRLRCQQFQEEKYQRLADINMSDTHTWFGLSPHQLRQIYSHWRIPDRLTARPIRHSHSVSGARSFAGETCFIIFLFHIRKGVPFTEMARHTFGGDPSRMTKMFDLIVDQLPYFTTRSPGPASPSGSPDTAAYLLQNLGGTTKEIKNAVGYILMIIGWIKCHGEIAILAAQNLRYFVHPWRQQFQEKC